MAMLTVLGVHGIGDHHTDLTWQNEWRQAISESLTSCQAAFDVRVEFFLYDELFAEYPITFAGSVEALAKLLHSGADNLLRHPRGLLDGFHSKLRWYAGMVVQWVENERLRQKLRSGLAARINEIEPQVICGHSLGSLVCYDTFTDPRSRRTAAGRTFLSLGSQLANPFVSGNFLAGRITQIEDCQWYHLFNRHDNVFTAPIHLSESTFKQVDTPFDRPGWADHDAASYLRHPATAAQVWSEITAPRREQAFLARSRQALAIDRRPARKPLRRALVVGINDYPNPQDRLEGCVNDAFLVSSVLQECGFDAADIRLLLDSRATAQAIRERLNWLLDAAVAGDQLVFYYSGHGAQLASYGAGDVVDQLDEALVPVDFDWSPEHSIRDDQLYELYSQLPYDVDFVMVLDCCHSGGMQRGAGPRIRGLDPPDDIRHRMLRWSAPHQMWVERTFRPFNRDLASSDDTEQLYAGVSGATRRLGRALELRSLTRRSYDALRRTRGHYGPYLPVVLQACREAELAYEYKHGVIAHGAFTFALAKNLRQSAGGDNPLTFQALVRQTAHELTELGYAQTPALIGPATKLRLPVPWTMPHVTVGQRKFKNRRPQR